jgi:hypothetical protein
MKYIRELIGHEKYAHYNQYHKNSTVDINDALISDDKKPLLRYLKQERSHIPIKSNSNHLVVNSSLNHPHLSRDELFYTFSLHSYRNERSQEHEIMGIQNLKQLHDNFYCLVKEIIKENDCHNSRLHNESFHSPVGTTNSFPASLTTTHCDDNIHMSRSIESGTKFSFFFIENVFYMEMNTSQQRFSPDVMTNELYQTFDRLLRSFLSTVCEYDGDALMLHQRQDSFGASNGIATSHNENRIVSKTFLCDNMSRVIFLVSDGSYDTDRLSYLIAHASKSSTWLNEFTIGTSDYINCDNNNASNQESETKINDWDHIVQKAVIHGSLMNAGRTRGRANARMPTAMNLINVREEISSYTNDSILTKRQRATNEDDDLKNIKMNMNDLKSLQQAVMERQREMLAQKTQQNATAVASKPKQKRSKVNINLNNQETAISSTRASVSTVNAVPSSIMNFIPTNTSQLPPNECHDPMRAFDQQPHHSNPSSFESNQTVRTTHRFKYTWWEKLNQNPLHQLNIKLMNTATLEEMNIRVGERYLYVHHAWAIDDNHTQDHTPPTEHHSDTMKNQNDRIIEIIRRSGCIHYLYLIDIKIMPNNSSQSDSLDPNYPRITYQNRLRKRKCEVCEAWSAKYITFGDKLAPKNPFYYCQYVLTNQLNHDSCGFVSGIAIT